jgi:glucans biosynthesis protein C
MYNEGMTSERRHDLDWLRVIAILLLLYFHTAMIFTAEWDWHVKNAETSHLVLEFNYFLSRFRMALLFLVSGVGTAYALGVRGPGRYLRERGMRLLVPLVFGMLVVVPPQIYMERLFRGEPVGSFLQFWPTVLELKPYPAGNTSWHHLWFVAYLLMYSVAALPFFLWWRSERAAATRAVVERFLAGPGIYLLGMPLALVLAALTIRFPGPQNVVDDWARLLFYFLIFVYGFVLCRAERMWRGIEANRRTALRLALLSTVCINYVRWNGLEPAWQYDVAGTAWIGFGGLNSWFWVLAILGYGRRYLSFRNRGLDYANEGIYPFYILHQTVIVVLGFYVVQTPESILAKFLFTSTLSLALTVAIYELGVRPFAVMRFLFGMKPRPAVRPGRRRRGGGVRAAGAFAGAQKTDCDREVR